MCAALVLLRILGTSAARVAEHLQLVAYNSLFIYIIILLIFFLLLQYR